MVSDNELFNSSHEHETNFVASQYREAAIVRQILKGLYLKGVIKNYTNRDVYRLLAAYGYHRILKDPQNTSNIAGINNNGKYDTPSVKKQDA